jgi:ankyrin repeat protein
MGKKLLVFFLIVISTGFLYSDNQDFFNAVKNGDYNKVKQILAAGIDVDVTEDTKTALMLAAKEGHQNIVKLLLENGANINKKNKSHNTALHFAVFNKHNNIVKLLIEKGAEINAKGYAGQTPLVLAAEIDNIEAAKLLIQKGADIKAVDHASCTALTYAILHENKELINILKPMLIKYVTESDKQKLIEAVDDNNYNEVKRLVGLGIDVNMPLDDPGSTMLMRAVGNQNKTIVEFLLKAGADVDAEVMEGRCGFHFTICPLNIAVEKNNPGLIALLLKNGARKHLNQSLCITSNPEVTKTLIEHGADVNFYINAFSPLHVAVMKNKKEIVEILLNKGARVDAKINGFHWYAGYDGYDGETPLMWAARDGYTEIVRLLIKHGADVNAKITEKNKEEIDGLDRYGYTVLQYARENGHSGIVAILKEAGARD